MLDPGYWILDIKKEYIFILSSIWHPVSGIRHPAFVIRHLVFGIQYSETSIQDIEV